MIPNICEWDKYHKFEFYVITLEPQNDRLTLNLISLKNIYKSTHIFIGSKANQIYNTCIIFKFSESVPNSAICLKEALKEF